MTTIAELLVETQLSEHDFLELVAFERKVEFEGLEYATDHYRASFENEQLVDDAYSMDAMSDLLRDHEVAISRYWDEVPGAGRHLDAHIDTARIRTDRVAAGENPGGVDELYVAPEQDLTP